MDDPPTPRPGEGTEPSSEELARAGRSLAGTIALAGGGIMHLIVGAFVFATPLVAPVWASVLLAAVWLAALAPMWRWRRRRPLAVLALPFGVAAMWWAVVTAGDVWLGWTA